MCDRNAVTRGYCPGHYDRWRRGVDVNTALKPHLPGGVCTVSGCENRRKAKGFCATHYSRSLKGTDLSRPIGYQKPAMACEVSGCSRVAKTRGLCPGHYARLRVGTQPVSEPLRDSLGKTTAERLEECAQPPNESGCRIWHGAIGKDGYPVVYVNEVANMRGAHRVSYSIANGVDIPPGRVIHHLCAERKCVEPSHLRMVEPWENSAEMFERNTYLSRIRELEQALAELDPVHPLIRDGLHVYTEAA